MKVTKSDIGKSCLVEFDDIGRTEGMILDSSESPWVQVFLFHDKTIDNVEPNQIIEMGPFVKPPKRH